MTTGRKFSWVATIILSALVCPAPSAWAQLETRGSVLSPFGTYIVTGDFNRDGKLDIAVAGDSLQIFMGNGDGTFRPPQNYLVGTGAISVAAVDLNGDGILDLAVTDLNGFFILLGNGDGTFQDPVSYATPCSIPYDVYAGDFNGDHKVDLIVTYSSGACHFVSVFLGRGDGTLREPPLNSAIFETGEIGVGDFNRDGKLDIVDTGYSLNQVQILLGNGDGTFSASGEFPANGPESVAVADLRGNGKLDLITADADAISVLLGNGDGTFQGQVIYAAPGAIRAVVSDLNGDGMPDIAVAQLLFPSGTCVLLGNGDGTFQPEEHYSTGEVVRFVAAGDFNGDHKTDLVVPDSVHDEIITLLNTGVVDFSPTTPVTFPFQLMGTEPQPQTVTLTNSGKAALTISSITTKGEFGLSSTCGKSVSPGSSCDLNISFLPKTLGKKFGTVSIVDSASTRPQVIELSGSGTVASVSPLSLTFGPQPVGTASAPKKVTLTNEGTTAMSVEFIYTNGANYEDFSQTNNCPASLDSGTSCTIAVTFQPKVTGTRVTKLYMTDSGGGSPQVVTLDGTGT